MKERIFVSDAEDDRLGATLRAVQWLFECKGIHSINWDEVSSVDEVTTTVINACRRILLKGQTPLVITNKNGIDNGFLRNILTATDHRTEFLIISCWMRHSLQACIGPEIDIGERTIWAPAEIADSTRRCHWQKIFDYFANLPPLHPFATPGLSHFHPKPAPIRVW